MSSQGHLPGNLHRRRCHTHTYIYVPILPSHDQRAEARRRRLHVHSTQYDTRAYDPAEQVAVIATACETRSSRNGSARPSASCCSVYSLHGAIYNVAYHEFGGTRSSVPEWARRGACTEGLAGEERKTGRLGICRRGVYAMVALKGLFNKILLGRAQKRIRLRTSSPSTRSRRRL